MMNKNIVSFLLTILLLSSCSLMNQDKEMPGVPREIPKNPIINQTPERDGKHEDVFYFPNGIKSSIQEAASILPWTNNFFSMPNIGGLTVEWIELRDGRRQFGWWGTATHYSNDIVVAYRYPALEAFIVDEAELDKIWEELEAGGIAKMSATFSEVIQKVIEEQNAFLRHVEADGSGLTTSQEVCGHIVYVRNYHPERVIIHVEKIDDGSPVTGSTVTTSTWSDHTEIIWVDSFGGTYNILDMMPEKGEEVIDLLLDITSSIMQANGVPCNR